MLQLDETNARAVTGIRMVNFHDDGSRTSIGVRHVAIYVVDVNPGTQYGTNVSSQTQCIFNGEVPQNPGTANSGANYATLELLTSLKPYGKFLVVDVVNGWGGSCLGIRRVDIHME